MGSSIGFFGLGGAGASARAAAPERPARTRAASDAATMSRFTGTPTEGSAETCEPPFFPRIGSRSARLPDHAEERVVVVVLQVRLEGTNGGEVLREGPTGDVGCGAAVGADAGDPVGVFPAEEAAPLGGAVGPQLHREPVDVAAEPGLGRIGGDREVAGVGASTDERLVLFGDVDGEALVLGAAGEVGAVDQFLSAAVELGHEAVVAELLGKVAGAGVVVQGRFEGVAGREVG